MENSTMHQIALLASEKAKEYRDEEKEDKQLSGKDYDHSSYGAGFNIGAAEALEQFAEDLWLRMNDKEINQDNATKGSGE